MLPLSITLRDATAADLPAIVDIYNQSIPGGWSTADTVPVTVESRREWFAKFNPAKRPIWVAEHDGVIVGWVSLAGFFVARPAYDATAEISVYVGAAWRKQGIGRRLKQAMIDACPRFGVTTVVSLHFDHNTATQKLNDEMGFVPMGHLTEIAIVQGQKRGLKISGLRIPSVD